MLSVYVGAYLDPFPIQLDHICLIAEVMFVSFQPRSFSSVLHQALDCGNYGGSKKKLKGKRPQWKVSICNEFKYFYWPSLKFLVLLSPRHVTDSFKTTFRKRDLNKRFYLQSMMIVMLTHVMQVNDHVLVDDDGRGDDLLDTGRGWEPVPVHVHQEDVWLGGLRLLFLQHDCGNKYDRQNHNRGKLTDDS